MFQDLRLLSFLRGGGWLVTGHSSETSRNSSARGFKKVLYRFRICAFFLAGLLVVLAIPLYNIQIVRHKIFLEKAARQQEDIVELEPERGIIYDRNGEELTINIEVESLFADPKEVKEPKKTARILSELLDLKYDSIYNKLAKSEKRFVWIGRKLKKEKAEKIKAQEIAGLYFIKEPERVYPHNVLASHILGFVGMDNRGLEGLEKVYDKELRGVPVRIVIQKDGAGRSVFSSDRGSGSRKGNGLILTIDDVIQHFAEEELRDAFHKWKAKSATIIVMDPKTGEIIAMANEPSYDPNSFQSYPKANYRNRAIVDAFEPGSTFKIITACAALQEGIVKAQDEFYCENGSFKFENRVIRDVHKYKTLTFADVMCFSSNIGMTKVGLKIGDERLYRYIEAFGFGDHTGINMGSESRGILRPPKKWSKVSIAAIPYGQEVSVTPLQITTAIAAVANGGVLMKPRIVKCIKDPAGKILQEFNSVVVRRIISPVTSMRMTEILESVVEKGTGVEAGIKGYRIAGKTGTAQKINPKLGSYDPDNFLSSFVGYFPASDPKVVIYVQVDEPRGEHYGGLVAGPVFKKVAQRIIDHMGISPETKSRIDNALIAPNALNAKSNKRNIPTEEEFSTVMPNLKGKTIRGVIETMRRYPVEVEVCGSGIAVSQSPPPGTSMNGIKNVKVKFKLRFEKLTSLQ